MVLIVQGPHLELPGEIIEFPLLSCSVLQVGKTYELLNCDKHKSMLLKNGRDPGEVRPDIAHQVTVG